MKRTSLVSIVVGMALLGCPRLVEACSCGPNYPPPVLEQYNSVDAAFIGIVIRVQEVETFPDFYLVQFAVTGYWKGVSTQSLHLLTPKTDGACGIPFSLFLTQEFLVYADADWIYPSGPLSTNSCTRTRPIEFAQEDFQVLGSPHAIPVEGATWGGIKALYE